MNTEALKQLMAQGLAAQKAGAKLGSQAAGDIEQSARNPELKTALQEGSQQAQVWATRIDRALQEAGGSGESENPIVKAHYEVGNRIRQNAPDDFSRDLGIVAAAQLALHYWIAAFGTMRAYAKRAGLSQTEQEMAQCLQEAEQGDEKMTDIAISIMGG